MKSVKIKTKFSNIASSSKLLIHFSISIHQFLNSSLIKFINQVLVSVGCTNSQLDLNRYSLIKFLDLLFKIFHQKQFKAVS